MNRLNGVELREKKGGKFWFRLHLTHEMTETSIDALDLTVLHYILVIYYYLFWLVLDVETYV